MLRNTVLFYASLVITLAAPSSHAIVNMEDLHLVTPDAGFSGQFKLAANGASGNSPRSNVSAGLRVQWHQPRYTDFLVVDGARSSSNDDLTGNKAFLHLRHIHHISEGWSIEGFAQTQYNEFTRLSYRGLVGSGVRIGPAYSDQSLAAYLGAGMFYEREIIDDKNAADAGSNNFWRGNIYGVIKVSINESTRLAVSSYYQPVVDDTKDYRLLANTVLRIRLTDNIYLDLEYALSYDSQPPEDVERTDSTFRTAVNLGF
ncbi:MAG: hypothetical protein BMS9Abin36_1221 [Gammaproteobacteria bacterium]|nr:MAG: hypothetical protein BMS9Abin36_1221 [Gammaproteobacteria bacterium]